MYRTNIKVTQSLSLSLKITAAMKREVLIMVQKYQGNFFQTDSVSLPVNNVFRYYCIPHLGKPMLENLKENAANFSQIQHSSHNCTRYS